MKIQAFVESKKLQCGLDKMKKTKKLFQIVGTFWLFIAFADFVEATNIHYICLTKVNVIKNCTGTFLLHFNQTYHTKIIFQKQPAT